LRTTPTLLHATLALACFSPRREGLDALSVRLCKRRIPEDEVATKEIQDERVRQLNEKEIVEGDYVLYWMQEAQRAEYNHALE
jgi:hypothetical protein